MSSFSVESLNAFLKANDVPISHMGEIQLPDVDGLLAQIARFIDQSR